ncbi:hypothetical protein B0O99DRAFT_33294 [Bisporella sp. PMI_857]|nr:hypothetical protein B0O99DRAFT_33294 [Bisporella sp. PMI_857]
MEGKAKFEDFDDETVYEQSQSRVLRDATSNFVVDFGKEKVHIAFDVGVEDVQNLLDAEHRPETPVRWINIWAPNKQPEVINLLATKYKFSPRLCAVIKTNPPVLKPKVEEKHVRRFRSKPAQKDDIEANTSMDSSRISSPSPNAEKASHYTISKSMIHYQSIDVGAHFLCIGANWMHKQSTLSWDDSIVSEGMQQPLWTWLVLCDDDTVISLHEGTEFVHGTDDIKSMRSNTLSVLSQLSIHGHLSADPISLQTVRHTLDLDRSQAERGVEGASNLFYYLFDDWRAVYSTLATYKNRLEELQTEILGDMARKSYKAPNVEIIPRLHSLGRQVRQMQHLYQGYKNLIERILEPKATTIYIGGSSSQDPDSTQFKGRGVPLAQSASVRFERLGDRLHLLILNGIDELLAEKDALVNTYFNINAQKDSEATARLTRSATLLAKLSVLFLPVSLMTAYFSVQIEDLNHYSSKDYWYSFAVIMCLSVSALFFFGRLLMYITETLDNWVKGVGIYFGNVIPRFNGGGRIVDIGRQQ